MQPSSRPSQQPSSQPSSQPSRQPTGQPSRQPSRQPTDQPSRQPTSSPTNPTGQPTAKPSTQPTNQPTTTPTELESPTSVTLTLTISGLALNQVDATVKDSMRVSIANALGVATKYVQTPTVTTTRRIRRERRQLLRTEERALSGGRILASTVLYVEATVLFPASVWRSFVPPTAAAITSTFESKFAALEGTTISVLSLDAPEGLTASGPTAAPVPISSRLSNGNDSAGDSETGMTAGIAAGAVGAVMLVLAIIFYEKLKAASQKLNEFVNTKCCKKGKDDIISNSQGSQPASFHPTGSSSVIPWEQLEHVPTVDKKLEGGYSVVFRAKYKNKLVAVKIFRVRKSNVNYSNAHHLLLNEAETLIRARTGDRDINEGRIVYCYGISTGVPTERWLSAIKPYESDLLGKNEDGSNYLMALVLRFETGGSLHDLIHPKVNLEETVCTLATVERLRILQEVCEGLHSLHICEGDSITHGDLKPGNILLSDKVSPEVRLADFGLSKTRSASSSTDHSHSTDHADAGGAVGTWAYMAPELEIRNVNGKLSSISRTTDIYSLGTLMWEVLSGGKGKACLRPWIHDDTIGNDQLKLDRRDALIRGQSLSCDVPDVFPLDVPKAVIEIIKKCLSFEIDGNQRALERQRQRPNISDVLDVVTKARDDMLEGKFDIFLSYNWGPQLVKDKVWKRQELVKQVYKELTGADYRVWFDVKDMETDMDKAMREGVQNSSCVVLFFSPEYCTKPNCLKELQFAHGMKKPIIVCMPENDFWMGWKKNWTYDPPGVDGVLPWTHKIVWDITSGSLLNDKGEGADGDIVRKLDLLNRMFCDFKKAYEVNWASKTVSPEDKKRVLYDCQTAMPQLLLQIRNLPEVGCGLRAKHPDSSPKKKTDSSLARGGGVGCDDSVDVRFSPDRGTLDSASQFGDAVTGSNASGLVELPPQPPASTTRLPRSSSPPPPGTLPASTGGGRSQATGDSKSQECDESGSVSSCSSGSESDIGEVGEEGKETRLEIGSV